MPLPARRHRPTRRAFTLVELLVVVAIIVILIGLLLPAMGRAFAKSKGTAATSQMKNFLNGCDSFVISNKRLPGYYPMQAMAAAENGDPSVGQIVGFTAMENALLDLAGGVLPEAAQTSPPQAPSAGNTIRRIGPYQDDARNVYVDTLRIGASDSGAGYINLSAKDLLADEEQFEGGSFAFPRAMPEYVDPWGNPLMLWVRDEGAPGNPSQTDPQSLDHFARRVYVPSEKRALFYWSTNAGYLRSPRLGNTSADQDEQSTLGGQIASSGTEQDLQQTMAGVLGSPAAPVERATLTDPWRPLLGRGSIIVHSAGEDGVYFKKSAPTGPLSKVGYAPSGIGAPPNNAAQPPLPDAFDDLLEATGG